VTAFFHDPTLFQHHNAISMHDGRKAVRNDHNRAPPPHLDQAFLDFMFGFRI
jgi:hypothetical protein